LGPIPEYRAWTTETEKLRVRVFATLFTEDPAGGAVRCREAAEPGWRGHVTCVEAFGTPAVLLRWSQTGADADLFVPASYAPFPALFSLLPVGVTAEHASLRQVSDDGAADSPQRVTPLALVGHFEREFDVELPPLAEPARR
jgi:hypothetical protein